MLLHSHEEIILGPISVRALIARQVMRGCEIAPIQCAWTLFRDENQQPIARMFIDGMIVLPRPYPKRACVMGAAYLGGFQDRDSLNKELETPYQCPACYLSMKPIGMMIHLNNEHAWTREAIADWLANS